ncbi:hypothetical protein PV08_01238 [Exophiala spinifera]|uniref:Methyltransferase type 11 domain-containing protein n=1 Tax=Exophiala spinifera TaxID=91928 RepID=A0A0D1YZD1_9EURO|nr:uncharacterized protein PV08_01238 [Exophiala spinifera]KIW20661.1 hypothetical protein PV08_01238 [Exophiala spinifera]
MAGPDAFKQRYFTEIGPKYAHLTGNTTRDLLKKLLNIRQDLSGSITSNSVIHDNACGPGTATEALISWCYEKGGGGGGDGDGNGSDTTTDKNVTPVPKSIVATDYVPAMIEAGERIKTEHIDAAIDDDDVTAARLWQNVRFKVTDSSDLSEFPDGTFTHGFCNFSVFNLTHPERCLGEMYRTLRGGSGSESGATAVVTCWKRFAASDLLSAAQRIVMGDEWERDHRLPVAGPEYLEDGYLADLVRRSAGGSDAWETVETIELKHLVKDEEDGEGRDWDGLYEFLTTTSLSGAATKGWTDDQVSQWPQAVKAAMKNEKERFGGLLFEAWAVVATKKTTKNK